MQRCTDIFKDDALGRIRLIHALHNFGAENEVTGKGIEAQIEKLKKEVETYPEGYDAS